MKTAIEMALEVEFEVGFKWCVNFIELERLVELARADEREACAKTKAGKPRELKAVGRGMLLDEQQFCFDKGWREGAASVRAAIRARSEK